MCVCLHKSKNGRRMLCFSVECCQCPNTASLIIHSHSSKQQKFWILFCFIWSWQFVIVAILFRWWALPYNPPILHILHLEQNNRKQTTYLVSEWTYINLVPLHLYYFWGFYLGLVVQLSYYICLSHLLRLTPAYLQMGATFTHQNNPSQWHCVLDKYNIVQYSNQILLVCSF